MNKSKLYMIISITILSVVVIVSGITYAWYVWSSGSEDETKIVTNFGAATVNYDGGSDINGNLRPTSTKEEGMSKSVTVQLDGDITDYDISFNLYLDIITLPKELKEASFKYEVYKEDILISEGNFSTDYLTNNLVTCTTNNTNHIVLVSNETVTQTVATYTLYLWIDGNMSNPNTMQNQNFEFKLHADGEPVQYTIAEYITDLYTKADKATVTNNSITYNYATSVSLMNDRLGGTTTDLDAGNIRYYGANPNNYIYFNCSDYSNQSADTCELWRIIGVFDGMVKIIRNESIGSYSWDNKNTSTGAESASGKNDWTTARLMKLLNPSDYFSVDANDNGLGQSLYYTAQSGTCYSGQNNATKDCDFTNTGLKNDITRNMIEEVNWNLGGWNAALVYSNQIYGYERGATVYSGRPTSWTGKVALMYPSDYGYATDFNKCTKNLRNYNSNTDSYACRTNDWLYNSANQWLLTPLSSSSGVAWLVLSSGYVYDGLGVFNAPGVRPVLYLNSELVIESGDGSLNLPYRLSVS